MNKSLKILIVVSILINICYYQLVYSNSLNSDSSFFVSIVKLNVDTIQGYYFDPNPPNPFCPSTSFIFNVPENERITITLIDSANSKNYIIADSLSEKGTYNVSWDASRFNSGIYILEFKAGNYSVRKKYVLVR